MIVRAGSGWQTVLADLSLILFMVTAAALSQAEEDGKAARRQAAGKVTPLSPHGEPLAVYRAGEGAPPLAQWLAGQSPDARQQLTIVAQYPPGGELAALDEARALATQAGTGRARIVVEPGSAGTVVSLAYDDPRATLARGLQEPGRSVPDAARSQDTRP